MMTEQLKGKRAWTYIDKSAWGPGPWDGEPDRVFWVHNGLVCMVLRGPMGSFCGYVGVPSGHSMHGLKDDETSQWPFFDQPHGGLTWLGELPGDNVVFLCDLAAAGHPLEYASYWYFGFDCAHAGDTSPMLLKYARDYATPKVQLQTSMPAGWSPSNAPGPSIEAGLQYVTDAAESALLSRDVYRDIDYVLDEVGKLAASIVAVEKNTREVTALRHQENAEREV
jgi:hypothetical protein